ncbi:ABC transporter permease subunit [Chroococcidiopsis sp. FACHB-1243]|uniref:ABC transporter permease n=1 Tax=Chroococcidiopsis sp. [FACHB-1243] TaxID=2692781 RepID=UPI001781B24A|nr:ABC transporter permease subunit [Chroococcidiopsis sp. [FACHB-1243]]MBD2308520.1 ABC transporter permease subunit [Chroococcidiopsis sp. [FACHB-1243]]
MNPTRVFTIGSNVFREVVRDRILYIIALYALLLGGAVMLIPQIAGGAEDKIILDFGLAAMNILGLIVAVFVGTGLVNKEIEKRTVLVLIAKPISHSEFITGKHLGLASVLGALLTAMTAIFLALLQLNQLAYPLGSILLAVVYLFLQLSLITAIALVLGVFTSTVLATLLCFGVYLMGNLSQDLLEFGRLSKNPAIEQLVRNLYLVLPDLSRLDLKNQAVYGFSALPDAMTLITNAIYGVVYTVLMLAIAIIVFSRREF